MYIPSARSGHSPGYLVDREDILAKIDNEISASRSNSCVFLHYCAWWHGKNKADPGGPGNT